MFQPAQPFFKSAVQVERDRLEKDASVKRSLLAQETISSLDGYVRKCWATARDAKIDKQKVMLESAKQERSEYTDEKLASIKKTNGSDVFINITSPRCESTIAMLRDIFGMSNDKPWLLTPSPIPELPQEVLAQIQLKIAEELANNPQSQELTQQDLGEVEARLTEEVKRPIQKEAEKRAEGMEKRINDILIEGNWKQAIYQCISDYVVYKACILKAPIVRMKKTTAYQVDMMGRTKVVVVEKPVYAFERVSPFNIYEAPHSSDVNDGYLVERHQLTRESLSGMRNLPGYRKEIIDEILLKEGGSGWLFDNEEQIKAEQKDDTFLTSHPEDLFEALEFWGGVQGKDLIEWGFKDKKVVIEPTRVYQVNLWDVNGKVIKVVLNPDPLGEKPYHKASFKEVAGSFWGRGIPEILKDIQALYNSVMRSIGNNTAIASGPQVTIDTSQVVPGQDITQLIPWGIHLTDSTGSGMPYDAANKKPVEFWQPDMNALQLLRVADSLLRYADECSGIPSYSYGVGSPGGAGRTATGLAMFMNQAGKVMKTVVTNFEEKVVCSSIRKIYDYEMLFGTDESIKGDLQVQTRGITALLAKEQLLVRKNEFIQATSNPDDRALMGAKGRLNLLRDMAKSLELDPDDYLPDEYELKKMEEEKAQAQNMMALQQQIAGQQMAQGGQGGVPQQSPANLDMMGVPVQGTDTEIFLANKGA